MPVNFDAQASHSGKSRPKVVDASRIFKRFGFWASPDDCRDPEEHRGQNDKIFFLTILFLSFFLRLLQLDSLPGEMWGDVIEHHEMVQDILKGNFFIDYQFGGDGALFTYIATTISFISGLSFFTLKLSTAIIGAALTAVVYFLSKELFKSRLIAHTTMFLTAVSFWSITFSRQAKPHILVPLFVVLSILFALKKKKILAGIFLSLGMYSQAGFWTVPLVFLIALDFQIVFIALLGVLPLLFSFYTYSRTQFAGSAFFGEKLGIDGHMSAIELLQELAENIGKNISSFNFTGDGVFRHTIPNQPHLDFISGVFFIYGLFLLIRLIFKKKDIILLKYFFVPLFIIQVPSILDIKNPMSIPNMGRMIGIIPFVYMAVAYGIVRLAEVLKKYFKREKESKLHIYFVVVVLIAILILNAYLYFVVYPKTLPNENTPFGKIIVNKLDTYGKKRKIYLHKCCWGQSGQPEPNAIKYEIDHPDLFFHIPPKVNLRKLICQEKRNTKVVIVMEPNKYEGINCLKNTTMELLKEGKWEVATIVEGEVK